MFSTKAFNFFVNFPVDSNLPDSVGTINPYANKTTSEFTNIFLTKFFNDNNPRVFLFGINPGRFGGGLTGISFTDPVALSDYCHIPNTLGTKKELSSEFVYSVINEFGGSDKFYKRFFLTAIYPLALVKDGKNYNYYDNNLIFDKLKESIAYSIKSQAGFGAEKSVVISLGKKNGDYLTRFNHELKLFRHIEILEHPRYIMQYKRKSIRKYIADYLNILNKYY
jgi:hypothetical protein